MLCNEDNQILSVLSRTDEHRRNPEAKQEMTVQNELEDEISVGYTDAAR